MPQLQLPVFPAGSTALSEDVAVLREGEVVVYYHGTLPVFRHAPSDVQSFRFIMAQLYVNGHITQAKAVEVFGVTSISLKRAVKVFQEQGPKGFWKEPQRRGAGVLLPAVRQQVQDALDAGRSLSETAQLLKLNYSTLNKAVHAGHLHRPLKKKALPTRATRS